MIVVAAGENGGGYQVLDREREMVRLGRTAFGPRRRLSQQAIADGLRVLLRMTTLARLKGAERLVAVATSAVREATNGRDFLAQVKARTGLDVRLLSGEEEARLIWRAVRETIDLARGTTLLLDVGGGSTEWIVGRDGEVVAEHSLPLGSLRHARQLDGDPPSAKSLARLRRRTRELLAELEPPPGITRVIATSGTANCCADLATLGAGRPPRGGGGGSRELKLRELEQVIARLSGLERSAIAALPPVGKPRAESILPGAILLAELVRHAGVDRFLVCDRALREGLVREAMRTAASGEPAEGDVRRRQVLELAERAPSVLAHSQRTAALAVRLFDLTASLHDLGPREREWLEQTALLHDIGYSIQYRGHHKHSQYLIATAELDAFDPREIEIISHVARYHRGADPKPKHASFAALKPWQRRTVERLAALLRLADALDRTHAARVEELYCSIRERRVRLEIVSRFDVAIELETAREWGRLFEQVFACRLSLRQGLARAGMA